MDVDHIAASPPCMPAGMPPLCDTSFTGSGSAEAITHNVLYKSTLTLFYFTKMCQPCSLLSTFSLNVLILQLSVAGILVLLQ